MNTLMKKGLLLLSVVFLLGAFSCGQKGGVTQAEYDQVRAKLSDTETQLKTLQNLMTLAGSANQSAALLKNIDDLKKQNESYAAQVTALDTQRKAVEASLADVTAKYTALQKQTPVPTTVIAPPEEITEDKVEQAIFTVINQDRIKSGIPELQWGRNLYNIVKQHSKYMQELGRYEYSSWPFFQQIYWAAGYSSVDGISRGALLVWKTNQYQYEHGIQSKAFKYGAVGAYKLGDVIFITFMAADVP